MRRSITAVVVLVAVAVAGCTPDLTRERLEADVPVAYSHQFDLLRAYTGKPAARLRPAAECHRTGEHTGDQGPGSWACTLRYPDPDSGRRKEVTEVVLAGGDTCYQGLNPELNDKPVVRDVRTGQRMPNPLFQFDSCVNVYDGHTSVTR
jgi:hypothetical protein